MKDKKCKHKFEKTSSCSPNRCVICGVAKDEEPVLSLMISQTVKYRGVLSQKATTLN